MLFNEVGDKKASKVLREWVTLKIENYLDKLKKDSRFRDNPICNFLDLLTELDGVIKEEEGVAYDFASVIIFCGYVFVFGSGAYPVLMLSRHAVSEPIMLAHKKLSQADYPLCRLGMLPRLSDRSVLKERFKIPRPCSIVLSDKDLSHLIKIKEFPVLFTMSPESLGIRLTGEYKYQDKEDVSLIAICA